MFFKSYKDKKKKLIEKISQDPNTVFALKDAIEDERLLEIISKSLGINPNRKEASLSLLSNLKDLRAKGAGIKSLDGIELLNNLQIADLSDNLINKLPDYTINPSLYKNKDSLIYMDLSGNPFLDSNSLFTLEGTEKRRKFFDQFKDKALRFDLGEANEKVFLDEEINPYILYELFNYLTPGTVENRDKVIEQNIVRYILGKELFYNNPVYQNKYFINSGRLKFNVERPTYLNKDSLKIITDNFEKMLSYKDRYLIKALVKDSKFEDKDLDLLIKELRSEPEKISNAYKKEQNRWIETESYSSLDNIVDDSQSELINLIASHSIKEDYLKFLEYCKILEKFALEKPDKAREINALINRSKTFVNDFLNNYISIQNNAFLDEENKKLLNNVEIKFKEFVDNFKEKAKNFFNQDMFDLEVDLKYMDMLMEAESKGF